MIVFEHVSKKLNNSFVVQDVSFEVGEGEFLGLLGGSGAGKTTTLQMVNRLVTPTSGTITVAGENITALAPHLLRRRIGYCFQQVGLFGHMSVAKNIGITCSLLGWEASRIEARVDELLEWVELPPQQYRQRRPEALSGGQQQRVGVARALAAEPKVMLFDEPFGKLDPLTRVHLQDALRAIRRRQRLSAIFVTHDVVEAFVLCDRVGVMHAGKLIQIGTPQQIIQAPVNAYVQQLVQTPLQQAERVRAAFSFGSPVK